MTHLLHWALHEVVSRDASQKGSYVGPDKLTFDFSSAPLTTKQQVRDVEKLVNEKIAENAPVSWTEIPYADAKEANRHHPVLRREIRRHRACFADRRSAPRAERLLDGTLRWDAREIDRRDRAIPDRERKKRSQLEFGGSKRLPATQHAAGRRKKLRANREKFEALARKKPDIAPLPAFENDGELPLKCLKQIDARAAHLEKIEARSSRLGKAKRPKRPRRN